LARLPHAYDALIDRPKTEGEKLARYVARVEQLAGWLRDAEAGRFIEPKTVCALGVGHLRQAYDPAFTALSPERLHEALRTFEHDENRRRKGGSRVRGAARIAAELAVEVGAFGATLKPDDYDAAVDRWTKRLQIERARNVKPTSHRERLQGT